MKIGDSVRKEIRDTKIFVTIWIGSIATIGLLGALWNDLIYFDGAGSFDLAATISLLINVIAVVFMYILDVKVNQTNGLLGYWDWNNLNEEPPYTTISICLTFLTALVILCAGTERLVNVSTFDSIVLNLIFVISFVSIFPALISLNIFDGLKALKTLSSKNIVGSRKLAWGAYIYLLYSVMFSVIAIAIFFSSAIGFLTSLIFAVLIGTYYHRLTPVSCEQVVNDGLRKKYLQLRYRLFNPGGSKDAQDQDAFDDKARMFVVVYKKDVVGGVRVILSKGNEETLAMEKGDWRLRTQLTDVLSDSNTIAEVSRLVIERTFQRRGTLELLLIEVLEFLRERRTSFAFAVAPATQTRLYRRYGFVEFPEITIPYVTPETGQNLHLQAWDLRDDSSYEAIKKKLGGA